MTYARSSSNSPSAVRAAMIEAEALKLRQLGWSYDAIGEKMNMTSAKAGRAVRRALARLKAEVRESAKEVVDIELSRLDVLLLHAMTHLQSGDLDAVDKVLKIMDRRAKYLGLNAPEKMAVAQTGGFLDLSNIDTTDLNKLESLASKLSGESDEDGLAPEDLAEELDYGDAVIPPKPEPPKEKPDGKAAR